MPSSAVSSARVDHASSVPPGILIVEDDARLREVCRRLLSTAGYGAATAASGEESLRLARTGGFELLLVDLRLPDMLGTDVIRALRDEHQLRKFVLMSGFLTVEVTVEAMRLGAFDVLPKPVHLEHLLQVVRAALQSEARPRPLRMPPPHQPRSTAERWAQHVLRGCEADGDLRTLEDWATSTGVSYSSLREVCLLVGVPPHDARDFTRVLAAILKAAEVGCRVDVLLNVSDRRTLRMLLARAALAWDACGDSVSVERFLDRQRFIPQDNEGLRVLRRLLNGHAESR